MTLAAAPRAEKAPSQRVSPLGLALGMIAGLAAFSLIPWVLENPRLAGSVWAACGALLSVALAVYVRASRAGRVLRIEVSPRKVHYVQLAMHTSIYIYWGWYWREVYHYAPLIAAQIVFFYALDMLVCWWRRDTFILGFGPFPIVLSTNLFLWFHDDWFYLQFLMIATAVLFKEFVKWERDGRRTHIFNPSAIALAIFSVVLLATGGTHISWAEEVSISLGRPSYMYLWIFATGIVVQSLFRVTLVTLSAAAALVALNLAYTAITGVYYFVDATIPIAVFLGLHLLVTDPATSPRRNIGKAIFGAMYGAAVFLLYAVLGWLGMPTFYDKLLCVPPMNLTARWLDRVSLRIEKRFGPVLDGWSPGRLNLAHMAVWIALFAGILSAGLVGSNHPGTHSEFWRRACEEGRRGACATWVRATNVACSHGSGTACYQLGLALDAGFVIPRHAGDAGKNFARACDLKTPGSCPSLVTLAKKDGDGVFLRPCNAGDGESCFVLASLRYAARDYERSAVLFRQACDAGWERGCGGLAELYRAGLGVPADPARAASYFERACHAGIAASCNALGRQRQACELSLRAATDNSAYFHAGAPQPDAAFCVSEPRP
uniref:Sel1 domain protein repeat-containing protein n=1 Tax=Solibacter usitatus (strain Ellin6076) TaxID=234267 RepID=Q02D68_SOLUE